MLSFMSDFSIVFHLLVLLQVKTSQLLKCQFSEINSALLDFLNLVEILMTCKEFSTQSSSMNFQEQNSTAVGKTLIILSQVFSLSFSLLVDLSSHLLAFSLLQLFSTWQVASSLAAPASSFTSAISLLGYSIIITLLCCQIPSIFYLLLYIFLFFL